MAVQAGMLSSLGVVLTAGFVGLFAHFVCKFSLFNSFLIGSVIASTDAASVFAILRDKHLNLKYNTASLLELESGSNDPFVYMLTIIVLSTAQSRISALSVAGMIFMQLLLGIAFGTGFAIIAKYVINKAIIKTPGFDIVFIIAIVLLAYAATSMLGGNGYLSVYITGIILGNTDILGKKELVPFFDGITGLMQIVIFFLLGLLAYPSRLPQIAPTALILAVFITLIARPFTVSLLLLLPFKARLNQIFLISWAGFRGVL